MRKGKKGEKKDNNKTPLFSRGRLDNYSLSTFTLKSKNKKYKKGIVEIHF